MRNFLVILIALSSLSSFAGKSEKALKKAHKKFEKCVYKTLKKQQSDIFFIEKIAMLKSEALHHAENLVTINTQLKKCQILKKEAKTFEKQELKDIEIDLRVLLDEHVISEDIHFYILDAYLLSSKRKFMKKYLQKQITPNPEEPKPRD